MSLVKYWDGSGWKMIAAVQGPQGVAGAPGPSVPAGLLPPDHARYTLSTPSGTSWQTVTPVKHSGSGDAAAFSISGASVVVRDAGTYHIAVNMAGPANTQRYFFHVAINGAVLMGCDSGRFVSGTAGVSVGNALALDVVLAAGDLVRVDSYLEGTAGAVTGNLSITRLVQGAKGDPGPAGGAANQIAQSYAVTSGYTKDRAFNPLASNVDELARVLATFIDDAKAAGLIQP